MLTPKGILDFKTDSIYMHVKSTAVNSLPIITMLQVINQ